MAYSPEQIQQAMRAAMAAKDTAAVDDLRGMLTAAYQSEVKSPVEEMSGLERFTAGMGQGATNIGRQLGRAASGLTGGRLGMSAEDVAKAGELDAPLLQTGAGGAGALTGEILATAPVGGLAGAAAKQGLTRAGMTGAGRMLGTGLGAGATQGAAEGALTAQEGQRMRGAATGAALGAGIPYVGGKVLRAATRGVGATPAARRLMAEGADLTPGQMNPNSMLGQIEEASQNLPIIGPGITRARENAKKGWEQAVIRRGTAPGQPKASTLEGAYQSFEGAYSPAKGVPVYPKQFDTGQPLASFPKARGMFEDAVRDRGVMADANTRKTVNSWLQNKLTQLPGAGKKTVDAMPSDDLLKLRSDIRTQIRKVSSGANPNTAQADLLRNAEQKITDVLESQLDPKALAALKSGDRGYAQYKVVEDAVRRSGDNLSGLTPSQLSAAVKASTPASLYARGGGGELRRLASSGKQVFDQRTPPTGARLLTMGALGTGAAAAGVPLAVVPAAATALAAGIGTKTGRKIAGGNTAAQRKALQLTRALRRNAGTMIPATATAGSAIGMNDFLYGD